MEQRKKTSRCLVMPLLVVMLVSCSAMDTNQQERKETGVVHHLLSPAEFESLCPFNLDTKTCFNQYLLKLVEKTEVSKRSPTGFRSLRSAWGNQCPPGEDSRYCIDRYVKSIKLLKKRGVTPSALHCEPGASRMSCFDKYISAFHMAKSRRSSLCPPGESKVTCFDRYINHMKLKPSYGKRGHENCLNDEATTSSLHCLAAFIKAIKSQDEEYLVKRGVNCSPGEDELGCFDQYVQKLHLKHPTKAKREAVGCGVGENDLACLDRHISKLKLLQSDTMKRAANFQCGSQEGDLSCFDRYISHVKLLPQTSKRAFGGDFGCAPGDDPVTCFDGYVKDIKLQRGLEKRNVMCQPGEDSLSCFDRHVQQLRLREHSIKKRSTTPLSDCMLEGDSLTCLDRYIRYLKLANGLGRKRSCNPAVDGIACLDPYISDLKLRNQKRAPMAMEPPFCAPGEDGLACLDQYVQHIKVRYLPSKRFAAAADCTPGEESYRCFDRYVNDLKLKHRDLIKRSPIFCPPGEDSWGCLDQYINTIKMKGRRSAAQDSTIIPSPERRSRLSLRSGETWPLCPPSLNRVQCFDRYLILMLKSLRNKDSMANSASLLGNNNPEANALINVEPQVDDDAEEDDDVSKRAGKFCPSAMDNVECFHRYLSQWIISASSPPKRTFKFGPGKRGKRSVLPQMSRCSSDPKSSGCLHDLIQIFITVADIRTKPELQQAIQTLCETSKASGECEYELRRAAEERKMIDHPNMDVQLQEKEREERSICPSGVDQVRCFESLLHAYMHKVVPKGSTEFVGRRSLS